MEMELLLAIATLLGGAAAIRYFWDKFKGQPAVNEHDIQLYEKYKALFVTNGIAEFYKSHDFFGSFRKDDRSSMMDWSD